MCQEVVAWLTPALGCLLFGAIGWWLRRDPDATSDLRPERSGIDKMMVMRVRFFRFLAYPFLVAGIAFAVAAVREASRC